MGDRASLGNTTNPPTTRVGEQAFPGRGMGTYERRPGTKPIETAYELPEHFTDGEDVAKTARLYAESVAYPNLAQDPFVVGQAKMAVLSGLKDVYNVMEFLRNKWLILYRLYRGENLAQFSYGRPQLHSPEPFKAVETVHPRVMRTLFGNQRWFKLYGVGEQDDVGAKMQEGLCRHQLREANFLDEASRFVRDGLIYGTALQKLWWKQEIGDMRYRTGKRVPDPDFPGASKVELSEIEREELLFDGNTVKNVSIFDFYTSPNSTSVEDSEWCADRSAWADFEVKQMGELGHWLNLEQLKDRAGTNDMSFGDEFKERKSYSYGVFDPRQAAWAPHIPHYTVIDWWGPLVIAKKGGSYKTAICNVVMIEPDNMQTIVRITENPYWHKKKPYQSWRPIQLHQEFYGIGQIEMIARLSQEKDLKRNLGMAAMQLAGNPMFLLSDEANVPDGQLILQPGLTLRVPDVQNSIAPLHVPDVGDVSLKAENIITKDIRETNGTTSPMMGAQDPFGKSGKTATQHTSEIDEANSRLVGSIENYEHQVVEPMLNQMTWNNQQFMSYDKVIREVGPLGMRYQDRYTIRPQDLLGRFLVQPLASHRLTTKQVQVQQLTNLLDRAPVINQMYGPMAVKMPKLMAYILEIGHGILNADDFITVPPEEGGLMTALEEHECWYHGNVPPRRADDNDMRHVFAHMQELMTERFKLLEDTSPGTASRAVAHLAEHQRKIALVKEQQEKALMEMGQMQSMMGGQNGGSPIAGAAGPGQAPGSPQVRRNENQRGEQQGSAEKSEAGGNAPNAGAQ